MLIVCCRGNLQKHLRKMFAGVATFLLSESNSKLLSGVQSREGEAVMFKKPVNIEVRSLLSLCLSLMILGF